MKICLIGFTRSRSSIVLETISNFHQIPILGQEFNEHLPKLLPNRDWMEDTSSPAVPDDHLVEVKLSLKEINDCNEGIVRYHPDQLSFIPFSGAMLDLDLFNFKHYDKIIFTVRHDVAAMIGSRFIATVLNQWTYNFQSQVKTVSPRTINNLDYYHIKLTLYNKLVVDHLKKYFAKNDILHEEVDYDDVPAYLNKNFPTTHYCSMVKTNYDYKSIITNFNEIMGLCEKFKPEVESMFNRFNK
jgi:hypothetical protein